MTTPRLTKAADELAEALGGDVFVVHVSASGMPTVMRSVSRDLSDTVSLTLRAALLDVACDVLDDADLARYLTR